MQTFLPSSSFKQSVEWLDNKRLNKQILEALTIYNSITKNEKHSWVNHPISKMWKKYPEALLLYYNECLHEWKEVRHRNHIYETYTFGENDEIIMPSWLGDNRLHSSHRANLLRKDYGFYSKYSWDENKMEYWRIPYWWGEEYGYGKFPIER